MIAWRGLVIASKAEDRFGSLIRRYHDDDCGPGVRQHERGDGLLPTKGIPLPLVSSGGSSLLVSLLGVVCLNTSQHESADA